MGGPMRPRGGRLEAGPWAGGMDRTGEAGLGQEGPPSGRIGITRAPADRVRARPARPAAARRIGGATACPWQPLCIPVRPDAAHGAPRTCRRPRRGEPAAGRRAPRRAQRRQRPRRGRAPKASTCAGASQRNNWQCAAPTPDDHSARARAPHCSGLGHGQVRARHCARAARRGGVSAGAADGVHA